MNGSGAGLFAVAGFVGRTGGRFASGRREHRREIVSFTANLKNNRVMMNLCEGELYVFSKVPADVKPIYAVFEAYESGCSYVKFMLSSDRFETEGCLPDGYVCARPATESEKADFERALEFYRLRILRIERCLSERGIGDVEDELGELSAAFGAELVLESCRDGN